MGIVDKTRNALFWDRLSGRFDVFGFISRRSPCQFRPSCRLFDLKILPDPATVLEWRKTVALAAYCRLL